MSKSKNPETIALHGGEYRRIPQLQPSQFQFIELHLINLIIQVMPQIFLH